MPDAPDSDRLFAIVKTYDGVTARMVAMDYHETDSPTEAQVSAISDALKEMEKDCWLVRGHLYVSRDRRILGRIIIHRRPLLELAYYAVSSKDRAVLKDPESDDRFFVYEKYRAHAERNLLQSRASVNFGLLRAKPLKNLFNAVKHSHDHP